MLISVPQGRERFPSSLQRCRLTKAAVKNVLPAGALFRGQDIQAADYYTFRAALCESSLCSFLFKEKAEKEVNPQ
jgi:hypothetical protein